MNITIEIKCPEMVEAINNLASAITIRSADQELKRDIVKPAEKPFLGAEKAVSPPKAKATPEEAVAAVVLADLGVKPVDLDPQPAEPEAPAVDYTQVKAAVMAVNKAKGRDAAVALLGEFNAKVGGDLTEEQWGPFVARAEEVLA
jgi:hypothetical protein